MTEYFIKYIVIFFYKIRFCMTEYLTNMFNN